MMPDYRETTALDGISEIDTDRKMKLGALI